MTLLIGLLPSFAFSDHRLKTYEKLKEGPTPSKVGDVGFLSIDLLRPTQIALGEREVSSKSKKLGEMSREKRHQYILKHPIPIILGQNGEFYVVDHHHLARALWELGKGQAFVKIVGRLKSRDPIEFWKQMFEKNLAYPFDENGNGPLSPCDFIKRLPIQVSQMKDDPYRSLAGAVRDKGGFIKNEGDYFIEFVWANFFRKRVTIESGKKGFRQAVQEALELAHSAKAVGLPGYTGDSCKSLLHFQ